MTEVLDDPAGRSAGRVALIVVATGLYGRFLPDLISSATKHVTGLHRVFVLSDERPPSDDFATWLPWGHLPWPYPTLLRYRAISAYADTLRDSDVLVYVDVDMLFTGEVDLREPNGLISVIHPGFEKAAPADFPFERREASRVSVRPGQGANYFAGGVQGGTTEAYLEACAAMAGWVQEDLDRDVIPVWHDESVWNRWCIDHPPSFVLDSVYCTPEGQRDARTRIVALDKNHDVLRQTPALTVWRRRLDMVRRKARSRSVRVLRRALGR